MKLTRLAAAAVFSVIAVSTTALAQSEGIATFAGSVHTDNGKSIASSGKIFLAKAGCRVDWETRVPDSADRKDAHNGAPDRFHLVVLQLASEPGRTYTLNPERKTYSVRDAPKETPTPSVPDRAWKIQKLGRDTVAGFSCEKVLLTSDRGNEMELCVTRELTPSDAWTAAMSRREDQAGPLKALKANGVSGFPIRWIFRSEKNKDISSTMELVSFEKKSLPASLFEIPPDYKKTEGSGLYLTPEQQKAMDDARKAAMEHMTPEQRKKMEEYLQKQQPAPTPRSDPEP